MAFGALNLGTDITAFYFILKKYVKKKKKTQKTGNQETIIDTNRKPILIRIGKAVRMSKIFFFPGCSAVSVVMFDDVIFK